MSRCIGGMAVGLVRGMALGLGLFSLVSLGGLWLRGAGDANTWWIDAAPEWAEGPLILVAGICLIAWGTRPAAGRLRRRVSVAVIAVLAVVAVVNAVGFYRLIAKGTVSSAVPIPVSLLVAGLLGAVLWQLARPAAKGPAPLFEWTAVVLGISAFVVLFPLAQILLFGWTDYRRPADAIVILGARTYADGTPSQALADRVRSGCELYSQGLAPLFIMSGGPGDGATHETVAMQNMATTLGVPAGAIVRDEAGINTAATIRNLQATAADHNIRRVLAVSHSWHLPRIKLAAARGDVAVYTVPCRETRTLSATPFLVVREVIAFWRYYVADVVGV